MKAGGKTIGYEIHKHTISIWNKEELPEEKHNISIWNKEELPEEWKHSITVPVNKKGDQTAVITEAYESCQLCTKFYPTSCYQG
jgi:hypothetical protein